MQLIWWIKFFAYPSAAFSKCGYFNWRIPNYRITLMFPFTKYHQCPYIKQVLIPVAVTTITFIFLLANN
jgi:hypothetical protein